MTRIADDFASIKRAMERLDKPVQRSVDEILRDDYGLHIMASGEGYERDTLDTGYHIPYPKP